MNQNLKVCRFCMKQESRNCSHLDIFTHKTNITLNVVEKCTGLCLDPSDCVPPVICEECISFINKVDSFIQTVIKSDKILSDIYNVSAPKIDNNNQLGPSNRDVNALVTVRSSKSMSNLRSNNENDTVIIDNQSKSSKQINESIKKLKRLHPSSNNDPILYLPNGKRVKLSDDLIDYSSVYKCDICNKNFDTFFEYYDHQDSHNGRSVFGCLKRSDIPTNRKSLVIHENNHKIKCNQCNVGVLPKKLGSHLRIHSDKHKYDDCGTWYTSEAALMKAKHINIKGFVCHICGKQSSCQYSMKRHLETHCSTRTHDCEFCNFSARSRAVLKVHTTRKHAVDKSTCTICSKRFKSEMSLKQHRKRTHNPKRHECDACGKYFSERLNLRQHVSRQHSKQRIYKCPVCSKEFFTVRSLKTHKQEHRSQSFKCSRCGQKFSYKKLMDKHMLKCTRL